MFTLSYTKSTTLLDTLTRIDALRTAILTTPLIIQTEQRLVFRSMIQSIYNSLSLSDVPMTNTEIFSILTKPKEDTSPTCICVLAYRNALWWISKHWMGNTRHLSTGDLQVLATIALTKSSHIDRYFSQNTPVIDELTAYLSTVHDHPVIHAGLLHAYFLFHPVSATDNGKFARIASTLILSKYGYTLRGIATHMIETDDKRAYSFAQSTIPKYGQYTQWLEYIARTVEKTYIQIQASIAKELRSSATLDRIDRATQLSKREEDIVTQFSLPTDKITNRQIQHRFHISSITASRHLKKLSTIGFLCPHGKGRSVYYTKI